MILSGDSVGRAIERQIKTEDFFDVRCRTLFETVVGLFNEGKSFDDMSLGGVLSGRNLLKKSGGRTFILECVNSPTSSLAFDFYCDELVSLSKSRGLIYLGEQIVSMARGGEKGELVLSEAERLLIGISDASEDNTIKSSGVAVDEAISHLTLLREKSIMAGIATGFRDFDNVTYGLQPGMFYLIAARPAVGKAQPLDAPILKADGWSTMGELKVGDKLASVSGESSEVLAIHERGVLQNYRVSFSDGRSTECCGDHLWEVFCRHWEEPRILSTLEIIEKLKVKRYQNRIWIRRAIYDKEPVELPIDPWVLGFLIGEGCLSKTPTSFSTTNEFALCKMKQRMSGEAEVTTNPDGRDHRLKGLPGKPYVRDLLKQLGLFGTHSWDKFIPDIYKNASYSQKLELIQGLMDSDGYVSKDNAVSWSTVSEQLKEDVKYLIRSIGGYVSERQRYAQYSSQGQKKTGRLSYELGIFTDNKKELFTVPQKKSRAHNKKNLRRSNFVSIEPTRKVESRCITVSDKSNLYFTDDFIVTHNSSLALGMAHHIARKGLPVIFFSLEMSSLELTNRMLSFDSGVDYRNVLIGSLDQEQWQKVMGSREHLTDIPLYIDDDPRLTLSKIKAKSRKIKSSHGQLGAIFIDYLQLMSMDGKQESRQVEISEISRGLKILSKELGCPVVALSQLNRQLEYRQDKRPMLADLRESGCLTGDAKIALADGTTKTIEEMVSSSDKGYEILTTSNAYRIQKGMTCAEFYSGEKEVFSMSLTSGKNIKATANHKFLTIEGWKRLDELKTGDRIATPRKLKNYATVKSPEHELILLAHLIGDGCFAPKQPLHYTSGKPELLDVVAEAALNWDVTPRKVSQGSWWHLYLGKKEGQLRNPIKTWLATFGLDGKRSHEKFIPDFIFKQDDEGIALFLKHLWSTDGTVKGGIAYSTTSRALVVDVETLLLRLGIKSRTSLIESKNENHKDIYQLAVSGKDNKLKFLTTVGSLTSDITGQIEKLEQTKGNTNVDTIPHKISEYIVERLTTKGISRRKFAKLLGEQYCGSYQLGNKARPRSSSRERIGKMADILQDQKLKDLSEGDVFWDEIKTIQSDGVQKTYDLTVLDTHNFIANNIITHNSLEQDADVVTFLYRDEIYDPNTDDLGIAELIIAKNRRGQTKTSRLAFVSRLTQFKNIIDLDR